MQFHLARVAITNVIKYFPICSLGSDLFGATTTMFIFSPALNLVNNTRTVYSLSTSVLCNLIT